MSGRAIGSPVYDRPFAVRTRPTQSATNVDKGQGRRFARISSTPISRNHPPPLRIFRTVVSAIPRRDRVVSQRIVVEVESLPPFELWLSAELKWLPQRCAGSGGERRAEVRVRLSQQAAPV
eukprot:6180003-Pleurochrysis_carterae.AAC.3